MEEKSDIESADGGDPKESSDTSSNKESVGDTGFSPQAYGIPPWFERFECESTVPEGLVWCTCDLTVEECCADICDLLKENAKQAQEYNRAKIMFTPDYLRWSCCPPGYLPGLHIGIWDGSSGKLVAFLAAVPIRVRVMEESIRMAWIHFQDACNDFNDKIPEHIIRSELSKRIRSQNIQRIVRQKQTSRPAPMSFPLLQRPLNSRKLFSIGYFKGTAMTPREIVEFYELPVSPNVRGFKLMNASHVKPFTSLLNTYLRQFKVAREFDEEDVKHLFLPIANLVHSYVYVGPDENITGFCSFVILRETIMDIEFTSAFSFYNFTVGMPLQQLMRDAMILALEAHCDLFIAYKIMSITDLLMELRFHLNGFYSEYHFNLDDICDLTKEDVGLVLL